MLSTGFEFYCLKSTCIVFYIPFVLSLELEVNSFTSGLHMAKNKIRVLVFGIYDL